MLGSIQDKLLRVRAPRVKITYDVETAGAMEKRELPFIVGIFSDLTGDADPGGTKPELKERKFVDIDRDNFDKVLEASRPYVGLGRVPNVLEGGSGTLGGGIAFRKLDDFEPLSIVMNVPKLRELYDARTRIRLLQAKAETSDELAKTLDGMVALDGAGEDLRAGFLAYFQNPSGNLPVVASVGVEKTKALELLRQFSSDVVEPLQKLAGRERARALRTIAKSRPDALDALNAVLGDGTKRAALSTSFPANSTPEQWLAVAVPADATADLRKLIDAIAPQAGPSEQKLALKLLGELVTAADAAAAAALKPYKPLYDKAKSTPDLASKLDSYLASTAQAERDALLAAFKPGDPASWPKADVAAEGPAKALFTLAGAPAADADKSAMLSAIGSFAANIVDKLPSGSAKKALELMSPPFDAMAVLNARVLAGYPGADPKLEAKQAAEDRVLLSAAAQIDSRVAQIDRQLSRQLSQIMQAGVFKQLEATWRGMHYLVSRSETGEALKLRVLNVSQDELLTELKKAVEFDQSSVFKMIYEAEYGTFGGAPYSLLVGDYEFGRHPQHIELLGRIAEVAAAAHAPFISSAYAKLFDLESFENLARPRDLQKIFESDELIGWRAFRESEDSRYVTLALPRVLLRLPYGPDTVPAEGLNFEEDIGVDEARGADYVVPDSRKFLWGNPAWVLAERITNAFSLYGWTAAIRGVEGGGLVEGLPVYTFRSQDRDIKMICPTQVAITDRREKELNDLGFMAICHRKGSNKAAFFGGQTTNKPKKYVSDLANSNAQISAMLPYILAAARFAHYIKVIMRDKVGSFMTRANVESFLNSWVAQYVLLDDSATQEVKARFPLRQANVLVTDVPGKPGAYKATVFLKPHFQLEELTTSIRLVAELPS